MPLPKGKRLPNGDKRDNQNREKIPEGRPEVLKGEGVECPTDGGANPTVHPNVGDYAADGTPKEPCGRE